MRRGEYIGLFTDTEVNNYISINQKVNQWSKKLQSLYFYAIFWICKQTRKLTIASLVKLRRRIMFQNKTLPWKTPKAIFVAFGMAFSFIYKIWAALKLSRNQEAMLSILCAVMRARNILGYPRIFLDREPIRPRKKHFTGWVYANDWYWPNRVAVR